MKERSCPADYTTPTSNGEGGNIVKRDSVYSRIMQGPVVIESVDDLMALIGPAAFVAEKVEKRDDGCEATYVRKFIKTDHYNSFITLATVSGLPEGAIQAMVYKDGEELFELIKGYTVYVGELYIAKRK